MYQILKKKTLVIPYVSEKKNGNRKNETNDKKKVR